MFLLLLLSSFLFFFVCSFASSSLAGHKVLGFVPEHYLQYDFAATQKRLQRLGVEVPAQRLPNNVSLLIDLRDAGYLVAVPSQDYDDSYCIGTWHLRLFLLLLVWLQLCQRFSFLWMEFCWSDNARVEAACRQCVASHRPTHTLVIR